MSHVDEGTIHALLDGALAEDPERARIEAHIEACADCRARFEAGRAIRERAAIVLRGAAPDAVRVEPFETILARRRRATAAGSTGDAASDPPAATETPVSAQPAAGQTVARGRHRFYISAAAAATVAIAVTATWIATRLRTQVPQQAADAVSVEPTGRATAPVPRAESANAVADARAAQGEPARPADDRRDLSAAALPAPTAGGVAALEEKAGARVQVGAANDAAQRQEVAGAQPPRAALQAAAAPATPEVQSIAGGAVDTTVANRIDATYIANWEDITPAEAERVLGRAPATVEGLPVAATQTAIVRGTQVVRVLQRVDSMQTIEVLQWPAPAVALDEVAVARADTGARTRREAERDSQAREGRRVDMRMATMPLLRSVTVDIPGAGTIAIRGSLPHDSLRTLAARIR